VGQGQWANARRTHLSFCDSRLMRVQEACPLPLFASRVWGGCDSTATTSRLRRVCWCRRHLSFASRVQGGCDVPAISNSRSMSLCQPPPSVLDRPRPARVPSHRLPFMQTRNRCRCRCGMDRGARGCSTTHHHRTQFKTTHASRPPAKCHEQHPSLSAAVKSFDYDAMNTNLDLTKDRAIRQSRE